MSTVVHLIDTITEWAQNNICDCIKLKQPPKDMEAPTAVGYEYKLVTPTAFSMYLPTTEKLPPNVHSPFPSLCVGVSGGEDSTVDSKRTVDVQFSFSTWDTGLHGKDTFTQNGDGWRDAWNFLDIALRAIESVDYIGGYTIDKSASIKYGPLAEQEGIPDLYPTWYAWITFRVNCPLVRNNQEYKSLL